MPRILAQHRMTLCDFEWPFHALRAISAVTELLVLGGAKLSERFTLSCFCIKTTWVRQDSRSGSTGSLDAMASILKSYPPLPLHVWFIV